jgi:hypothetical protein
VRPPICIARLVHVIVAPVVVQRDDDGVASELPLPVASLVAGDPDPPQAAPNVIATIAVRCTPADYSTIFEHEMTKRCAECPTSSTR